MNGNTYISEYPGVIFGVDYILSKFRGGANTRQGLYFRLDLLMGEVTK